MQQHNVSVLFGRFTKQDVGLCRADATHAETPMQPNPVRHNILAMRATMTLQTPPAVATLVHETQQLKPSWRWAALPCSCFLFLAIRHAQYCLGHSGHTHYRDNKRSADQLPTHLWVLQELHWRHLLLV